MGKNIGFNRNIRLAWLDATATLCGTVDAAGPVRAELERLLAEEIVSTVNRRKAIDILISIWVKTGEVSPRLRTEAVRRFDAAGVASDRLWLHYGLTLLYYPFFRETAAAIGQLARFGDPLTPALVKQRLVARRGQLGSLDKAVERVIFSMRDWKLLCAADERYRFQPVRPPLSTDDSELACWLLACVLRAHPAEELPLLDLVRLPELFPFKVTVGIEGLRRSPFLSVQRQGSGWDMVRVTG